MVYHIVLCKVLSVDLDKRIVMLEPLNSPHLDTIDVEVGKGLKFASIYAPFLSDVDPKTGRISNVPSGAVNYPQPGDRVVTLVWMTDIAEANRPRIKLSQNPMVEVIVLARVNWEHPLLGPYDHIFGDQSGAKVHFNHGWLDTESISELPPDYMERGEVAKPHQLRTGHVTQVGNRFVRLAGRKFLPFGLFSHLLGQAGDTNPIVFPEDTASGIGGGGGRGTSWKEIFSNDPTASIFDNLLDAGGVPGGEKFLEPPCPDPSEMMDMHESGYKVHVEQSGHVRKYFPRGAYIIVGDDSSDTYKKMAFGIGSEPTEKNPGIVELHFYSGSNDLKILIDAENDAVEITMANGKIFKVDGGASKITWNSAIEITGNLKVTGNIEATSDVKGATGTFG